MRDKRMHIIAMLLHEYTAKLRRVTIRFKCACGCDLFVKS